MVMLKNIKECEMAFYSMLHFYLFYRKGQYLTNMPSNMSKGVQL